ncbi:MAG TPA: phage integrase SAM-like domain-containing protein [Bradyrhizobium sp.]|nr:phage integrase SAM-like domain-containing protein [Bradyrhizobium sp.]
MEISHTIMGGRVHIYKRDNSRYWQCMTHLRNRIYRKTTGEESLAHAKQIAEDWYLELRGKSRAGLLKTERSFADAAEQFIKEYGVITEGQRSPRWVEMHKLNLRVHLVPFLGELGVSKVTAGKVQEYRVHRAHNGSKGKPPARNTIHNEIVTLRMVLKTAIRHGWLDHLPDLSPPYRTQGKVVHRPWFSPEDYKQLYEATRAYARKPAQEYRRWDAEQLHDFVLFMANTGLRPDEAKNLQHRDVTIAKNEASGEKILEIEVRGKRGVGFCKSMPGAVTPYERLRDRPLPGPAQGKRARRRRGEDVSQAPAPLEKKYPEPTDPVFPGNHIKMFNGLLRREKLKLDRDGHPRTAYSLRHTYICLRLMEGADIYQIAKNCRTSGEMIERHYAAHIKNTLDEAAINIRKQKPKPKKKDEASGPAS